MLYGSRFETSGFLPAKSLDRKKNHPPWLAALVWQHCMAPGPFRIVACEQDQYSRAGLGGDVDQGGGHQITSSVQAASVTTTSTLVDQNDPSDSRAMATIF